VTDRVERLLNLTATLLDARRPLSLEEIADRLEPAYPSEKSAQRRAFERDKETLRDLGVPISVETIDGLGAEQGYRIRPEEYYLPDLGLTPEERAALHVAITAVRLEGGAARDGLRKLGGFEGASATPLAELETTPALPGLFDAVTKRRLVAFEYRGEQRSLEPYGVVHRFGHWYVVGHDRDRAAPRAFRVDRIEGDATFGPAGAFETPPDVDPAEYLRADPLTYGDEQAVDAHVLVDASRAAWVVDELGDDAVVERRDDGSVVVRLSVVNREAFRTWVIGLLEHAEVLAPDELRNDIIEWLRGLVSTSR
jgi:predicted DNA-binding transcriptional regulator YafY